MGRSKITRLLFLVAAIATLLLGVLAAGCGSDDVGTAIPDSGLQGGDAATDGGGTDPTPGDAGADVATSSFNVTAAASTRSTTITVTFDAAPNAAQATTLGNYAVPGLTLSGTPAVTGNTVTLTTSAQAAAEYTVTVSNVTRASDGKPLSDATATFTGRAPFNVASAASTNAVTVTVTFDAAPNATQATNVANYAVPGLTLSGTPALAGNTVTLTTTAQGATAYTVTVSNVTRASDGEPLTSAAAGFTGTDTFNVASAASTGNTTMTVEFDAAPTAAQAETLANYTVPGLTLSGTPSLDGNVVTLTTSSQVMQTYTVTVSNVTRAADGEPLTTASANFEGRTAFNVELAASTRTDRMMVTFDAPPDADAAIVVGNYSVPGLTLSSPTRDGRTVTFTTTKQSAGPYVVTVSGVTRASDGEALATSTAAFDGRAPFEVSSAASTGITTMTVTFSHAPNVAEATTLANYAVDGLVLSGTPVRDGNTVTINTSVQTGGEYEVTVSNVTRAGDGEPLDVTKAAFDGTAVQPPTVTGVAVVSTNPDNGTVPYNTGTVTATLTGTNFTTVSCPTGVKLDDLNGIGAAVGTAATSCTVDSDTQITATFPRGIRTNGLTGWNVLVTNAAGTNAASDEKLVPKAGLLISEVFLAVGNSNADRQREFLEIYNPTSTSLDLSNAGLNVRLRTKDEAGVDASKVLSFTNSVIASHGFLLMSSSQASAESWFAKADCTYSAASGGQLFSNGSVYLSFGTAADVGVIDKVGWGSQPAGGFEGTAILADIPNNQSVQRLPAGVAGHATDTDVNSADFAAASAAITPRGTVDGPLPAPEP
jgi:hypothetical protein